MMLYTHKISFNLNKQENRKRISVVYGSRDTIAVEITLLEDGNPWALPAGTSCVIRYMKANGNGGVYHCLADGREAWQAEENRITIFLAPEALDVAGLLDVSIVAVHKGRTLGIYGFDIHVECNLPMPLTETENQLDFTSLSEINTAFMALQMKTDVDSSLSVSGKPADAAAVGAALSQTCGMESAEFPGCYYRTVAGATEWLNPPMHLGVEYRTVERHEGLAVYTMKIGFGNLPNASTSSVEVSQNVGNLVGICGVVWSGGNRYDLATRNGVTDIIVQNRKIIIITDRDLSGETATVTVRYYRG